MPPSRFLEAERRNELRDMLVPSLLRQLIRMFRYRKWFASAFVSRCAQVSPQAAIGRGCIIRQRCCIDDTASIGSYTTLGYGCHVRGRGHISIGSFTSIADDVLILSENHNIDLAAQFPLQLYRDGRVQDHCEFTDAPIFIGSDVWIGAKAIVLAGARVGHGCVVAAGAVVTAGEYPDYAILGGIPARVIGSRGIPVEESHQYRWWEQPEHEIFGERMDDLHEVLRGRSTDGES